MKNAIKLVAAASLAALSGCQHAEKGQVVIESEQRETAAGLWPALTFQVKKDPGIEARITQIMATMTIEQKVAQTIQPEIRDISVEDMRRYGFGSYLNGGGAFPNNDKHASVQDWVDLAEAMYQASVDDSIDGIGIPTMWGTDAVHGHNNVIGATLFPHNIGLGAANNPALIEEIAKATAREVLATGIDWIFAPTVAVARDDRWGRTYESYSEHPDIVRVYAAAIVRGLQGDLNSGFIGQQRVISTVKHFLGDGGTEGGDDQGDNLSSEQELFDIHAQGYVGGLSAGAQTVMASFNSWHGSKIHGNHYLLTKVLKDRMGFDGLVVGDWNGHGQIPGCSKGNCPDAMNAGLDIYMVPTKAWKPLLENTIAQVKQGIIPQQRLDDAVARILRVKLRAGLFDNPSPAKRPLAGNTDIIGAAAHRKIARQAVRESLVLLKNNDRLLPLNPKAKFLVAGDGADNIGKQSGGWSLTWQGTGNTNDEFPGATSIYAGLARQIEQAGGSVALSVNGEFTDKPDVAIVVFGEEPYAEGNGDLNNVEYQRGRKTDIKLLKSLQQQGIPVVSVFLSGRPLWVNPELNASDAFVAAWLPGTEGEGIADVLLTDGQGEVQHDFVGRLSFSWPAKASQAVVNYQDGQDPLFAYGYGLDYGHGEQLSGDLDETVEKVDQAQAEPLALYVVSAKPPWQMGTHIDGVPEEMTSNTMATDDFKVRTTDRDIQEDALLIEWTSQRPTNFGLISLFPEDYRGYLDADYQLSFDYLLQQPVDNNATLSMQCDYDCKVSFKLKDILKVAASEEWQNVTIDLQCFVDNGMNFASVFSPFTLTAQSPTMLAISNVRLVPVDKDVNVSCPPGAAR